MSLLVGIFTVVLRLAAALCRCLLRARAAARVSFNGSRAWQPSAHYKGQFVCHDGSYAKAESVLTVVYRRDGVIWLGRRQGKPLPE
jgi:hypothetical protein